ncbi:MAG: DUF3644 domain-containing protein [Acidobacteriota bacterium]|nr:DUF3644 domain-containing protein [Acidobacteriota bacterium]
MSRPKKHLHFVRAACDEALLACDLYNERRRARNLEAFIVHMSIAWLNLFQAICVRDHVDFYYRKGKRIERVDGEPKTWDLAKCTRHFIADPKNSVRVNIEFFIKLRNRIEHHFTQRQLAGIEALVTGKVQALFLNFERKMVEEFGKAFSMGESLRFPISVSYLTEDAVEAVRRVYNQVPVTTRSFIEMFEATMDDVALSDPAYDFRVFLVPKTSSKAKADLAIEFVDLAKLTAEGRAAIEGARVIIRDRHVEAANLDRMRAGEVVEKVRGVYPAFSTQGGHVPAWKHFKIRPNSKAADPTKTDARYCVYDRAHRDYLYTDAWVDKLKAELADNPDQKVKSWKSAI